MGITSQDLADAVPGAKVAKDFEELTNWLYDLAQPGDLILTVGAGDIYTVGKPWSAEARNPPPDALCAAEGCSLRCADFFSPFLWRTV